MINDRFGLYARVAVLVGSAVTSSCSIVVVGNGSRTHFKTHSIATACGRTFGCQIEYAGVYQKELDDARLLPPLAGDILTHHKGLHIGIGNFPKPAVVKWKSSDGASHEALVDIGSIFKRQRFLHRASKDEIFRIDQSPVLVLVVEDRTIRVYMETTLILNYEQIPGSRLSMVRRDVVMAYEKTY